jgi:hypothetical protein
MNRVSLLLLFLLFFNAAHAQIFRYRLSANSGAFLGEAGRAEIDHPNRDELTYPGSKNFRPTFKPGAELEIMRPVSMYYEWGLQFGYSHLGGYTPQAPLYNFFLSKHNPLRTASNWYPSEALIFSTKLLSIQATGRWHFLPLGEKISAFMKLGGGVSFVGTDFTFDEPAFNIKYDVGMLFSQGTKNGSKPKTAAFTGSAGFGATYRISDRLDVYLDMTTWLIDSDVINGVPNFDYTEVAEVGTMNRTNALSAALQASVGLIYSGIPDRRFSKGNVTRSGKVWKRKMQGARRR